MPGKMMSPEEVRKRERWRARCRELRRIASKDPIEDVGALGAAMSDLEIALEKVSRIPPSQMDWNACQEACNRVSYRLRKLRSLQLLEHAERNRP